MVDPLLAVTVFPGLRWRQIQERAWWVPRRFSVRKHCLPVCELSCTHGPRTGGEGRGLGSEAKG